MDTENRKTSEDLRWQADDRCTERAGVGKADAGYRIPVDCKVTGAENQSGAAFLQGTWTCRKWRTRSAQLSNLVSAEQPLSGVRCKSHAAENRAIQKVLLATMQNKSIPNQTRNTKYGGMKYVTGNSQLAAACVPCDLQCSMDPHDAFPFRKMHVQTLSFCG